MLPHVPLSDDLFADDSLSEDLLPDVPLPEVHLSHDDLLRPGMPDAVRRPVCPGLRPGAVCPGLRSDVCPDLPQAELLLPEVLLLQQGARRHDVHERGPRLRPGGDPAGPGHDGPADHRPPDGPGSVEADPEDPEHLEAGLI